MSPKISQSLGAYTILRFNLRSILLRPFQFRQKHVEVMFRALVVLGLGQG